MSNIYNVVKQVLEADTMNEATSILYGINGIAINSREYYQTVISNFIRKKEMTIRKENNRLVFDLNNYNDIWNIVFIAEYIKENDILFKQYNELLKEINNIKDKLIDIKKKHKLAKTSEEHSNINREYQLLNNILIEKQKDLESIKNINDTFYNIDWIDLENETDTIKQEKSIQILKQAITIIHKFRNSFAHGFINEENIIKIHNDQFNVEIPIEYLDGFVKGRIIAKEEDKIVVEKTNNIVLPLLEELNYDPKKIESFFYNVEPNQLSYILKLCNNDIKTLYQLPTWCFYERNNTYISYFLDRKNNFDNNVLKKLKYLKYVPYPKDRKDYSSVITLLEYLRKGKEELNEDDIKIFNIIGKRQIIDANNVIIELKELKNRGLDFLKFRDCHNFFSSHSNLNNLFEFLNIVGINEKSKEFIYNIINLTYYNVDELLKIYKNYNQQNSNLIFNMGHQENVDDSITLLNFFNINNLNEKTKVFQILLGLEYEDIGGITNIIPILNKILSKNKTISEIDAFVLKYFIDNNMNLDYDEIEKIILFFDEIKTKTSVYNFQIALVIKLKLKNPNLKLDENLIEKLIFIQENDMTHILLETTNIEYESKIVQYLNKQCTFDNLINDLEKNNTSFQSRLVLLENETDIIKNYKQDIIDKNLLRFIDYVSNGLNDYFNIKKDIKNNEQLRKVETILARRLEKCSQILKLFQNENNEINSNENKILENYVKFNLSIFNSIEIDNLGNIDEDKLNYILENIEKFDTYIENNNKEALKFFFSNISRRFTYDLLSPESIRTRKDYQTNNVETLLRIFDNDYNKLNELPYEFFVCNPSLLGEMLQQYNLNISKSIFGIDNPKIICLIVYMNSVFRKFNERIDIDLIDVEPIQFIHSSFNDTIKYKNTIEEHTNNNVDQESFLNQFCVNDNSGEIRDIDEIKEYILNKLRNSSMHFRFKIVKDENDNIINDKIYLYDEYNDGRNNFNIIVDIKELFNVIRQIELSIDSQIEKNNNVHKTR